MKRGPLIVDGVRFPRQNYPWRNRVAMIRLATLLGWHSFNEPREDRGMIYDFPVRGLHPTRGRIDDLRSRENVPDFDTLDQAWALLNRLEIHENETMRSAFHQLLGENWLSFTYVAGDLRQKIVDAAYTVAVAAEKQGWL